MQANSPSLWARLTYSFCNLIFPAFCDWCDAPLPQNMRNFCVECWQLVLPISPIGRCPHCFCESDKLCRRCAHNPRLPMVRATIFEQAEMVRHLRNQRELATLAPYYAYQWSQLSWPSPSHIAALPPETGGEKVESLAKAVARLMERPYVRPLRIHHRPFFRRRLRGIKQECKCLLLIDIGSRPEWQHHAAMQLLRAGVKEVYLLVLVDGAMAEVSAGA